MQYIVWKTKREREENQWKIFSIMKEKTCILYSTYNYMYKNKLNASEFNNITIKIRLWLYNHNPFSVIMDM